MLPSDKGALTFVSSTAPRRQPPKPSMALLSQLCTRQELQRRNRQVLQLVVARSRHALQPRSGKQTMEQIARARALRRPHKIDTGMFRHSKQAAAPKNRAQHVRGMTRLNQCVGHVKGRLRLSRCAWSCQRQVPSKRKQLRQWSRGTSHLRRTLWKSLSRRTLQTRAGGAASTARELCSACCSACLCGMPSSPRSRTCFKPRSRAARST
mmetsp:Transcript_21042/g.59870  ORF Transcript_21042/g.59870 Transcript_21042/m.59870 type:complete len:209 (+) Transcript_21042:369-995(+)